MGLARIDHEFSISQPSLRADDHARMDTILIYSERRHNANSCGRKISSISL
jgi:hypothetical protein